MKPLLALLLILSYYTSAQAQSSSGNVYSPTAQYCAQGGSCSSSPSGACSSLGAYFPNPATVLYPTPGTMCGYTCDIPQWDNFCGISVLWKSTKCPVNGTLSPDQQSCECPGGSSYFNDVQQCVTVQQITAPPRSKPINNGNTCAKAGDPINIGTGNSFQTQTDLSVATLFSGLAITRTYNSLPTDPHASTTRSFGTRWTQPYDVRIVPITSTANPVACWKRTGIDYDWCGYSPAPPTSRAVSVLRGDGKALYFSLPASGAGVKTWTPELGVTGQLVSTVAADGVTSTRFTFTDADNHSETFDANGVLLSIKAQGGSTQQLTYSTGASNDSKVARYPATAPVCSHVQVGEVVSAGTLLCVTDHWGRQLHFAHDKLGRITKIIAPDKQVTRYAYDGASGGCIPANGADSAACRANNLTSINYPDGKTKILHYNEATQINGGKACPGSTPVGNGFGYLINALTGITDENGTRAVSWTFDCRGMATSSQLTGGADTYRFAFGTVDANGNSSTVVTNPSGALTTFGFTSVNGHILNNSVAQAGGTSTSTYDAHGNLLRHTDLSGQITQYTYDTTRNLQVTRVEASGTTQAKTFTTEWHPTYRLPAKVAQPLLITTYTYDGQGNLLTQTEQDTMDTNGSQGLNPALSGSPRAWSYTYNNLSQFVTITGPRTDIIDKTTFTYGNNGNLSTIQTAAGETFTLTGYDTNGRVGISTDPDGLVTHYTYNSRGWLISSTQGGLTTYYSYDTVGELSGITYSASHAGNYRLGAMNRGTITNIDLTGETILGIAPAIPWLVEGITIGWRVWRSYQLANNVAKVIDIEKTCPAPGLCPPCKLADGTVVPVGTISYRLDLVPPSRPHAPFTGDHVHLYKVNQIPKNCNCFWQPINVVNPPPPAGAIPIQPFVN